MLRKKRADVDQRNIDPDNELLLWEKWIKIRNEETKKLAHKLNRPPVDLTMNLVEKVREEKEWKTVLEHAKIDKKPSVRGQIWEQPQRLKQSCYCTPVYEMKRTRAEMGKPPVIEHVSVPEYILKVEKGLSGLPERVKYVQAGAEFVKYRNRRERELKKKIDKIDPFRPEASNLMVRGTKANIRETQVPKKPLLPSFKITEVLDQTEDTLRTVYAVRINNTIIIKDIPNQKVTHLVKLQQEVWHEPCTTWSYYFNASDKKPGRCKIFFQNLGTVTLRYCWKKIKQSNQFIPEDIYEQVFFFNKNEDVLSPGQSKEIHFTFVSNKAGIYSELWELSFSNICFYDNVSEKLCVNLYADSIENYDCNKRKIEILKDKIDYKAKQIIVIDIIYDILNKVTATEPQKYPYQYLMLEREMFEMKNPVCFYHQTEVMKMKDLFLKMSHGEEWNLSITTWREVMMKMEFEDRIKYYELLKKSHVDLLKPWYEVDDLLKEKHKAVKLLLEQMANKIDKKYAQLTKQSKFVQGEVNTNVEDKARSSIQLNPNVKYQEIRNLFYIHAYEYVATTIELCAGVLSSLDLNRWIDFDFCRS